MEAEYVRVKCFENLGGVGSSIVQHEDKFYILFGLTGKGYAATVTKVEITERQVEKADTKRAATHTRLLEKRPIDEASSSSNIA